MASRVVSPLGAAAGRRRPGDRHPNYLSVARIEDAYALLKQGAIQAIVYDAPVLAYYANTEGKGEVQVVGGVFKEETYGIALPTGSPLRKTINEALLQLRQDGTLEDLQTRYFGDAGK